MYTGKVIEQLIEIVAHAEEHAHVLESVQAEWRVYSTQEEPLLEVMPTILQASHVQPLVGAA